MFRQPIVSLARCGLAFRAASAAGPISISNGVRSSFIASPRRSTFEPPLASTFDAFIVRNATSKTSSCEPHPVLTDDLVCEIEKKFLTMFRDPEIDGWDLRGGITELLGEDMLPSPDLITAILEACHRVKDYAMTTRFLEALHNKTGCDDAAFKWLMDAVRPTLDKYNISTPAELGYDKPELWKEDVYNMH